MCGGCYFAVKRFDPDAIIQFLLDRLIFSFDQIKEMECKVSWGLAIKPAMMPELRLLSIADGNSSGGVEEKSVHFIAWDVCTRPWLMIIRPFLPKPSHAQSSAEFV